MAGFSRSARGGKRSFSASSSSNPYAYYLTTAIFVVICIAGAWLLGSFSIFPSGATSSGGHSLVAHVSVSESSLPQSDPPPTMEDTQGELPEETIKQVEQEMVKDPVSDGGGEEIDPERKKEEVEVEVLQADRHPKELQDEVASEEEQEKQNEGLGKGAETDGGENHQEEETEQENKSDQHPDQEHEQEVKLKQKQREESSLDGGMEEEQKHHDEAQQEHDEQQPTDDERRQDTEATENSESREEEKPTENEGQTSEMIEQVSSENQKDNEEERKDETIRENQQQPELQTETEETNDSSSAEQTHTIDEERKEVDGETYGEKRPWATQADQSHKEKERRADRGEGERLQSDGGEQPEEYDWKLCNATAGPDYIPCLDNLKAIKKLRPENYRHYEHRERHCPEEAPTCLIPLPKGYKRSIEWPKSRDRIWYDNVPHTKLAEVKGHQNWVKVSGQHLTFPGGGTQFIHGALHYIDYLQESVKGIAWGKHTRVVLDVGCGVASFGGYLFERDVLTMSFAPKDEHEAQVQLALERGIPAISAVMGAHRLQFPGNVFDIVHCARCRVPWHVDGGRLLLELNRVLRPGGYFVWSATPVYQKLEEDVAIWKAMKSLTRSMCWDLVTIKKDQINGIGAAFFRKPLSNDCYNERRHRSPPMCEENDDPNAAWYIPLKTCMHKIPTNESDRGSNWPQDWPRRLQDPPYWLSNSQPGIYGKPVKEDFLTDTEHWKNVVTKSYLSGFGINWARVRNVMDMRAVYGGFAAALRDQKVWVMNVVNTDAPDTLPIIYERGLFGMYHDWCESFSTYPRTYDLLHADRLFSRVRDRCPILTVVVEVDRIVRPGGKIIVRDDPSTVSEVETLLKSLHWEVQLTFSKGQEGMLSAEKSDWRPETFVY
ncbi:S-adenosyl-L-methionine-dependent methyltransferases superfamily protein [Rhynchospora pubera]|uniref:S-adenosyl-L-methionine-dependent methyltransferases superfamily protein n=1 Tax=Rhynchospora pubera TaxID=906938 RepID=A0AAV8EA84_9POAL|nr:S-adenosyl-L-methionine-dependent methyltransferases superfamily protein [Rhynchospora pubera]